MIEKEWAFLQRAYRDWVETKNDEHVSRVLAIFMWHLPDHIACEFDSVDGRWKKALTRRSAEAAVKIKSEGNAHISLVQHIGLMIDARVEQNQCPAKAFTYWLYTYANTAKHGVVDRRASADIRNVNSTSSWEADDFWKTAGQLYIRDDKGEKVAFDSIATPIFEAIEQIIKQLDLDPGA